MAYAINQFQKLHGPTLYLLYVKSRQLTHDATYLNAVFWTGTYIHIAKAIARLDHRKMYTM